MSFTGDGVDQRLAAKGQLGLSAPVITAGFCAKQHKGTRLVQRVPALASEMIMKSLRKVWRKTAWPAFMNHFRK